MGSGDGYIDGDHLEIKNITGFSIYLGATPLNVYANRVPSEQPVIPSLFSGKLSGNNFVQNVKIW